MFISEEDAATIPAIAIGQPAKLGKGHSRAKNRLQVEA
jgi:hypothetical protein